MALSPGTILDNKYRIEAAIGRGGFGYVYRARERLTGEVVAIKELTPGMVGEPQVVRRFIQEARATLRLTHPHIARTYSVFEDGGAYYLAMEYLPGGSLADRLQRGPLPVVEAVQVAIDLCAVLDYAHARDVVHCDIKPANVLFDAQGQVRLSDFGIAHVSEQLMTRGVFTGTDVAMGTLQYMAPEQLEGVRDDPRLDIYALGALLYEMVVGRPYLDFEPGTTPAAQVRNVQRIQSQSPRPLRAVQPAAPEWLAQAVERALRKAPHERFATAGAFGEALQPAPIPSPTPGPVSDRGLVPALRRLRGWAWAVGGLLLVGVVGALVIGSLQATTPTRPAEPPTQESTAAPTEERTREPTPTSTAAPTEEPTPAGPPADASLGDTWARPADGIAMVYVPAGEFEMGSAEGNDDERPVHTVVLDGFWIDRTEVTNEQYRRCVVAGDCSPPGRSSSYTRDSYYGDSSYDDYPVIYVTWDQAADYCAWAGARVPTEAEWEYAARGPEGYTYPWGDGAPDCSKANYLGVDGLCVGDTSAVGSYPARDSWCGALDMAGNVWEWVADWYGGYPSGRQVNPTGPSSGEDRVARGGSWDYAQYFARCAYRFRLHPDGWLGVHVGFRCARTSQ